MALQAMNNDDTLRSLDISRESQADSTYSTRCDSSSEVGNTTVKPVSCIVSDMLSEGSRESQRSIGGRMERQSTVSYNKSCRIVRGEPHHGMIRLRVVEVEMR